jgi:hypothetical protein
MLELLIAVLGMYLEIFLEAAFEFGAAYLCTVIWRGVTALVRFL